MAKQIKGRRAMIAGLGAVATAGALGGREAQAQGASTPALFTTVLHTEDAWMSGMRGVHRIVLDVTTPEGVPDGIRFAGNLFNGHKTGYGVDEAEVAIIMCLRHMVRAWGCHLGQARQDHRRKATPPPTAKPSTQRPDEVLDPPSVGCSSWWRNGQP
jgi:hypothetical protein